MYLLLLSIVTPITVVTPLPWFSVYWESQDSYMYNDDEQHNPWYIDLGDIHAGLPGNTAGPSTVHIAFADTCVSACQESYPDEFCSRYPPEGIPAKPRSVDDWGTKFNITSNMLARDIPRLKAKGVKINLSYGRDGLKPYSGGGINEAFEGVQHADELARRMKENAKEWDLDGIDIFTLGTYTAGFSYFGYNAGFHSRVIKSLRSELPPEKTISYTIWMDPCTQWMDPWHPMDDVIAATHKYLDFIYIRLLPENEECVLNRLINDLGVPASKIGWLMEIEDWMAEEIEEETMLFLTNSVRERGLHGLSLFSVNKENNRYYGQFLEATAQELYA